MTSRLQQFHGGSLAAFAFLAATTLPTASPFALRLSSPFLLARNPTRSPSSLLSSSAGAAGDEEVEEQGLVLGKDDLEATMSRLQSKYPTSEASYLAASRKRAEEARAGKLSSVEGAASDADWNAMADEKAKMMGDDDAWEASKKEAGNEDSQILMFTSPGDDDDDGGDEEEPKLLLF